MSLVRPRATSALPTPAGSAPKAKDGIRLPHLLAAVLVTVVLRRWWPAPAAAVLGFVGLALLVPSVTVIQHEETRERFLSIAALLWFVSIALVWPWGGWVGWAPVGVLGVWMTVVVGWSILLRRLAKRWAWAKALHDAHTGAKRRRKIRAPIGTRAALARPDHGLAPDVEVRMTERANRAIGLSWPDYMEIVPWPRGTVMTEPVGMRDTGLHWTVRIPEVVLERGWSPKEVAARHAGLQRIGVGQVDVIQDRADALIWHLQEMTVTPFERVPPRPPIIPDVIVLGYGPLLRRIDVSTETDGAEHIGVFGTSGSGKTEALRWLAHQWIGQGADWIVLDPKGDLGDFAEGAVAYAQTMPDIVRVMALARQQMTERLYGLGPRQLYAGPRLVVLGDEMARWPAEALEGIAPLTALGRAARMPFLGGTQSSRVSAVGTGEVLGNIVARVVCRTGNPMESRMALGTYASDRFDASRLPDIPGRCYLIGFPGLAATEAQTWLLPLAEGDRLRAESGGRSLNGGYAGHPPPDPDHPERLAGELPPPDPQRFPPDLTIPAPQGGPLDITERQAAVYRLLTGGSQSVGELRMAAGLDANRVQEALAALVKKDLVERLGHGRYRRTGPPLD